MLRKKRKRLQTKNRPCQGKDGFLQCYRDLFSLETIATSTAIRVAIANVAYVNFTKRAIITATVILAIGYTTTDTGVYFLAFFIKHTKNPPFKVKAVCVKCAKIIDISKKFL